MRNEIIVSEYDMIGAELYYSYNYIENAKRIESSINNLNNKINGIEQKIKEFSSEDIINKDIDWTEYSEIQEKCKFYYHSQALNVEQKLKAIKQKYRKIKLLECFSLSLGLIGVVLFFVGCIFGLRDTLGSILFLLGIVVFIIGAVLLGTVYNEDKHKNKADEVSKKISELKGFLKLYTEIGTYGLDKNDLDIILPSISVNDVISIFHKYNPDFFSNLEKEKASYQNKINELKSTLNSIKNEFKENMSSRNTIIPSVYYNEDDITNLIDYYVRKRGDTWKELVNQYEHDKKLNQIISSIDNLSNQVNILTNGVVQCFNIIGQQLGIINQSILSLQNATAINLDKISQIENQQEKRLCELTSSIQNMNVKTKVIIESR